MMSRPRPRKARDSENPRLKNHASGYIPFGCARVITSERSGGGHRMAKSGAARTPPEHRYVPSGSSLSFRVRGFGSSAPPGGTGGDWLPPSVDSRNEGIRGSNPRVGFSGFAGKTDCVELFRALGVLEHLPANACSNARGDGGRSRRLTLPLGIRGSGPPWRARPSLGQTPSSGIGGVCGRPDSRLLAGAPG